MSISKSERSYITSSLLSTPHLRADGRSLSTYRPISLETGVAPLANGSARVSIGRTPGGQDGASGGGGGGTEVLAAAKLEVEDISEGGQDAGRIVVTVSCSPAAYPALASPQLDDLQHDLTQILHSTLSDASLHPTNLDILKGKKSWLLNIDLVVLAESGNVLDALFMAARAALHDTKVPRTNSVEYRAPNAAGKADPKHAGNMDVDPDTQSGFDTRSLVNRGTRGAAVRGGATDFELPDYWDEGEPLSGGDAWPIAVTLNLLPPVHYLDATSQEEASTSLRLLVVYSFRPTSETADVQGMRLLGPGELTVPQIKDLVKAGGTYARDIHSALHGKLKDEDVRRNQKARDRFAKRRACYTSF